MACKKITVLLALIESKDLAKTWTSLPKKFLDLNSKDRFIGNES
jgi:hypothetical protein